MHESSTEKRLRVHQLKIVSTSQKLVASPATQPDYLLGRDHRLRSCRQLRVHTNRHRRAPVDAAVDTDQRMQAMRMSAE